MPILCLCVCVSQGGCCTKCLSQLGFEMHRIGLRGESFHVHCALNTLCSGLYLQKGNIKILIELIMMNHFNLENKDNLILTKLYKMIHRNKTFYPYHKLLIGTINGFQNIIIYFPSNWWSLGANFFSVQSHNS